MACHDGSNPHLPEPQRLRQSEESHGKDTGATIPTLVRVSHIHLFGLTFIFFLVGLMFSHAYVRPVWLKCAVVALPFAAIAVDVSSWYIIKIFHPFVYMEIMAGGPLAICFGIMLLVTMFKMWLSRAPAVVTDREKGDLPVIGREPVR